MIITYPTNSELMEIEQELLPTLIEDDPAFNDLMPITNHDTALVEWEQLDNFVGLMQVRGLDGEPPVAPRAGINVYQMQPGTYGEWLPIKESELTQRRMPGSYNAPITLDKIVMELQSNLLARRIDRIRWIIWTLLTAGVFTVPNINGQIIHAGSFAIQTASSAVAWTTYATATPLADLRALLLLFAGRSTSFGPRSRLYMNRVTFNAMLSNTNTADLYGKRLAAGSTVNGLDGINEIMISLELPQIVIYDKGYYPDATPTVFTRFIPNGKVVVVGERPAGQPVGEFMMTRNAAREDFSPGPYTFVTDSADYGRPVPRKIRIDDGFNGGPALFYPGSVIVLTAY